MEFQAIVLAGIRGSRFNELTKKTPKCLLPIGNKPMIWYPVRLLEKSGFQECIIITANSFKDQVEKELNDHGIRLELRIIGYDDDEDDSMGTADVLHLVKEKIHSDCIILSCDLITNVNLHSVANMYRSTSAAFLMLLYDIPEQNLELPVPGMKAKYAPELDYIGFDEETSRLLYFGAQGDVENDIKFKQSVLEKYPCVTLSSRIQDAHLYFIKKCLIEYIIDNESISSLKGDFVPRIVSKQFSKVKPSKIQDEHHVKTRKNLIDYFKFNDISNFVRNFSSNKVLSDLISCYAYVQTDGICLRANNIAIYAEANRQAANKILPLFKRERERTESTSKFDKSQVGSDSIVSDGTKIGEKVIVKRSVIGKNCIIGDKAKVNNSILMDNVTIADNSVVTGSILCSNAKILAKSELSNCILGYSEEISTSVKSSNETIKDILSED